jgi:hypothetical protein
MKNDKLIPGLVLVLIGAAILLANYGYLHFHWYNIFRLWPIFLVIAGVNLVFSHNKSPLATIIKVAVVVLGLGLLFFGNFGERYNFWPGNHFNWSNNDNDDNDDNDDTGDKGVKIVGNGTFNEPYKADIKAVRLNISGGATSYNLSDSTNQLFSATTKDNKSDKYNFSHSMDDSVYVLDFHMKNHNGFNFDSDKNRVDFRLNPNPEWEINVETGASSLEFDLSKFKVKELKLHGGAASFHVKLGMPLAMTDVDVQTGVSGVDISIPQNAACSIESDSGLSSNDFPGFTDMGDNRHETPGYAAAKNKMHIHISGGFSGFNVKRY